MTGATRGRCAALWLAVAAGTGPLAAQTALDPLAGLRPRNIGPAGMSGRVSAVAVAERDPDLIYVGAATGGVWKTENGGTTWAPILDDLPVASIGAVAVFQPDPRVVWVGTGEGNPRNSAGVGRGIFRSDDAGRTWRGLGLARSERIHRVVLHPANPDVAYVGAMGPAWSDGDERGVYRTRDGGRTWERVLFVDRTTGAADLVMDPRDPGTLYAAMWQYRRTPWGFESGGPGSGLYVSRDAGDSWRRLGPAEGFPGGPLGRIGVAVARSRPEVVYALVEARRGALLRSDDRGHTWRVVNDAPGIAERPFYFADIRVDPTDENRLYSLRIGLLRSDDGGRTFAPVGRGTLHADHHDLWIEPARARLLIDANDGGIAISRDGGATWRAVDNLPLGQYYHISVDTATPYRVYGGMQDNNSWRGPAVVWEQGGIRNAHWTSLGFGDGFAVLPDPADPRFGYSLWQGGFLMRFDARTGERRDIRPAAPPGVDLRFNWDAALALDPRSPGAVLLGSQFLHRSDDRGATWRRISPDLTTNDPAKQGQRETGGLTPDVNLAESRHTTIVAIAPSPLRSGVIWVGTDDGNLQLTTDGGRSWRNLAARLPGAPAGAWVTHVEPSRFDPAGAFVVLDDHRRGDWTPYLFATRDYGATWRSLATPGLDGFAHVLVQDPVESRLLFLGTEFGLFASQDGGARWQRWPGLPAVPVRGLAVHPREHDLVIGTHGRSAWIVDDIRPLRALARDSALAARRLHLFDPGATIQYRAAPPRGSLHAGDETYRGENRPYGALLTYLVGAASAGANVSIAVRDRTGAVVRCLSGPATPGLNRVAWDLRGEPLQLPRAPVPDVLTGAGPEVPPGSYAIELSLGASRAAGTVRVAPDPRSPVPAAGRAANHAALLRAAGLQAAGTAMVERLAALDSALGPVLEAPGAPAPEARAVRRLADSVRAAVRALSERLISPAGRRTWGAERTIEALNLAYAAIASSWRAPTVAQRATLGRAERDLRDVAAAFDQLATAAVPGLAAALAGVGAAAAPRLAPLGLGADPAAWARPRACATGPR